MQIRNLKHNGNVQANVIEVSTSKFDLLLSYGTPVAIDLHQEVEYGGEKYIGAYKTDEYWSVTTSKHINRWYRGDREIPQELLSLLYSEL